MNVIIFKIELDGFKNNCKKKNFRGHFYELFNIFTEFDLCVDIVLILYVICEKFSFKVDVGR